MERPSLLTLSSVDAEAERMSCRVEVHPKCRTGLVLVQGGAEFDDRCARNLEVIDYHIEMHVLGQVAGGPRGWRVGLDLLERDALAVVGADVDPVLLGFDRPVQHRGVERRERVWIRTVDDDAGKAGNGHEPRPYDAFRTVGFRF